MNWAIVPVKSLRGGKTRLAEVLSEEQRYQLNYSMFLNTLNVLKNVEQVSEILVVSSDDTVHEMVDKLALRCIREEGMPDLNRALKLASDYAVQNHAGSILILHADLPLLDNKAVTKLLKAPEKLPCMVIAPDHNQTGTNAMYLSALNNFVFHFGRNSFCLHMDEARQLNYHIKIIKDKSLSLDLDVPEDINILSKYGYKIPTIMDNQSHQYSSGS